MNRTLLLIPSILLTVAFAPTLRAADAAELEAEAKEAQAEEDAENVRQSENIHSMFEGRLALYPTANTERPEVLGSMTDKDGTYLVKAPDPKVAEKLKEYNGKSVTVVAKLRNKKKYIVIQQVKEAPQAPLGRPKRGGI